MVVLALRPQRQEKPHASMLSLARLLHMCSTKAKATLFLFAGDRSMVFFWSLRDLKSKKSLPELQRWASGASPRTP